MSERFSQFSGLVDNCEYKLGEKETKINDLRGFWDMIYNQVVDVDEKFAKLSDLHLNGWIEKHIVSDEQKIARKKFSNVSKIRSVSKPSSGLATMIAARRKEMTSKRNNSSATGVEKVEEVCVSIDGSERKTVKEMIKGMEELGNDKVIESLGSEKRLNVKEMIAKKRKQLAHERGEESRTSYVISVGEESIKCVSSPERIFEGGFFSIKSPNHPKSFLDVKSASRTKSSDKSICSGDRLRISVLNSSGRRLSGLVSPYLSQVARRAVTRRSFKFDDPEDCVTTSSLDSRYLAPDSPNTPLPNTTSKYCLFM